MIKAVLVLNTAGKIRLCHFYESQIRSSEQQALVRKVFRVISRRSNSVCNFMDSFSEWPTPDTRVVYRRYATLCFIFVVDSSESQLAILDLIQVFVETLDRVFENVCELDLIFHCDKVQHVLMEMVMGGMVVETKKDELLRAINEQNTIAAASSGGGKGLQSLGSRGGNGSSSGPAMSGYHN